jgi:TrmH family RNA methyltransferase
MRTRRMRPSNRPSSLVVRPLSGGLSPSLIRSLRDRGTRDRAGLFLAEGQRSLNCLFGSGYALAGLVVRAGLGGHAVSRARLEGCAVLELSRSAFMDLSATADPPGVIAVVHQRWLELPEHVGQSDLWLGVETLRNPGNLGTLLRSAAAVSARGLIVFGPCRDRADPFDPGCVRASMGSLFGLEVVGTHHQAFRKWPRRSEVTVLAGTGDASRDFRTISYRRPTVIFLGHERQGLSEAQRITSDYEVRIPMSGPTDSFTVAMAGRCCCTRLIGAGIRKR